jgi:hypothetical protein
MVRQRHMTAFLVLLSVAVWAGEEAETPGVKLRASPRVSMAPPGGVTPILLTVQIVGPETEQYYCAEIIWLWPDGTRSSEESDCDPFAERTNYPRRFSRRIAAPAHYREYQVCVALRKGGEVFDQSCARYTVR